MIQGGLYIDPSKKASIELIENFKNWSNGHFQNVLFWIYFALNAISNFNYLQINLRMIFYWNNLWKMSIKDIIKQRMKMNKK